MATVIGGVASTVLAAVLTDIISGDDDDQRKPLLTSERHVRPFTDEGELRPPFEDSRKVKEGRCDAASLSSTDPAAWRCGFEEENGSALADPCWTYALKAVCLRSPWDPQALIIENVDLAPRAHLSTKPGTLPWALEIKDPVGGDTLRCSWAGGATATIAQQRVNWRCTDDDDEVIGDAAGDVTQSKSAPWTVLYSPDDSSEVQKAEILTVWY
ncbi:hypothetical protein [Streptomyces subrutilus]|uniref:hypothetical protein n=1 Tax=Streptomyces subrutilus TaxID=36818 RepID=UPI0033C595E0